MILRFLLLFFISANMLFLCTYCQKAFLVIWEHRFTPNLIAMSLSAIGFLGVRAVLSRLPFIGQFLVFIDTLEHEFTHIFAGLFFFKFPKSLSIKSNGDGMVELGGANFVIYLAPYCFPLWVSLFSVLAQFLVGDLQVYVPVAVGLLWGFYLWRLKTELHPQQTDFTKTGFVLSCIFAVQMNVFWLCSYLIYLCPQEKLLQILKWSFLAVYEKAQSVILVTDLFK
jgi:hypothetical protein